MAEIIGVAATAAQLAATSFSLLDLVTKIKGGSSTLKRYHQQLQELRNLSDSVSKNPLLQTPEVGDQTQTILSIIEDNCLASLLQKSRWLRTWGLLYREREISDVFVVLERQKASLSLAIEDIQSRALHQIQTDLKTMTDKSTNYDPKSLVKRSDYSRDQTAATPATFPAEIVQASGTVSSDMASLQYMVQLMQHMNATSSAANDELAVHNQPLPSSSQKNSRSKKWENCFAMNGVNQNNGVRVHLRGTPKNQRGLPALEGEYEFTGCSKVGPGYQYNAHQWIDHGANYGPDISFSSTWKNCVHLGTSEPGVECFQVNGAEFTQVPDEGDDDTDKPGPSGGSNDGNDQNNGETTHL